MRLKREAEREIRILYRDERLLLVDKPPGMMVHRNGWEPKAPSCVHNLAGILGRKILNVHRLDRATSGVMVFALDPDAADAVAAQFREREVRKRYISVVRGHLTERREINTPLKDRRGRELPARSVVVPICRTIVPEPVGAYREAWYSLVEIEIESGRRHQVRRHLSSIAHPVVGDKEHGDGKNNRLVAGRFGTGELLLRAVSLRFRHPDGEKAVYASAGLPEWWRDLLVAMEIDAPEWIEQEGRVELEPADGKGGT